MAKKAVRKQAPPKPGERPRAGETVVIDAPDERSIEDLVADLGAGKAVDATEPTEPAKTPKPAAKRGGRRGKSGKPVEPPTTEPSPEAEVEPGTDGDLSAEVGDAIRDEADESEGEGEGEGRGGECRGRDAERRGGRRQRGRRGRPSRRGHARGPTRGPVGRFVADRHRGRSQPGRGRGVAALGLDRRELAVRVGQAAAGQTNPQGVGGALGSPDPARAQAPDRDQRRPRYCGRPGRGRVRAPDSPAKRGVGPTPAPSQARPAQPTPARDPRGRRLPPAGHPIRNRPHPWRRRWRGHEAAARARADSDRRARRRRSAARCCTARRSGSSSSST